MKFKYFGSILILNALFLLLSCGKKRLESHTDARQLPAAADEKGRDDGLLYLHVGQLTDSTGAGLKKFLLPYVESGANDEFIVVTGATLQYGDLGQAVESSESNLFPEPKAEVEVVSAAEVEGISAEEEPPLALVGPLRAPAVRPGAAGGAAEPAEIRVGSPQRQGRPLLKQDVQVGAMVVLARSDGTFKVAKVLSFDGENVVVEKEAGVRQLVGLGSLSAAPAPAAPMPAPVAARRQGQLEAVATPGKGLIDGDIRAGMYVVIKRTDGQYKVAVVEKQIPGGPGGAMYRVKVNEAGATRDVLARDLFAADDVVQPRPSWQKLTSGIRHTDVVDQNLQQRIAGLGADDLGLGKYKVKAGTKIYRGMQLDSAALDSILKNGMDAPAVFNAKRNQIENGNIIIDPIQHMDNSGAANKKRSVFISATDNEHVAWNYAGAEDGAVVFNIRVPEGKGVDMRQLERSPQQFVDGTPRGPITKARSLREVNLIGSVSPEDILGYWKIKSDATTGVKTKQYVCIRECGGNGPRPNVVPPAALKGARDVFGVSYPESGRAFGKFEVAGNVGGRRIVVKRPNHDLSNGLRKAALVSDIIDIHKQKARSGVAGDWVQSRKTDPRLSEKVSMASLYSRTGRASENSVISPAEYQLSGANFVAAARQSGIFSEAEIEEYRTAIVTRQPKTDGLAALLESAHLLDIRRTGGVLSEGRLDPAKVASLKDAVRANGSLDANEAEVLWSRAEKYLAATGANDNAAIPPRGYSERFFKQHDPQNPRATDLMEEAIASVRSQYIVGQRPASEVP